MVANGQRLDVIFPSVFFQQENVAANLSFSVFGFYMFKANSHFGEMQLLIEHADL